MRTVEHMPFALDPSTADNWSRARWVEVDTELGAERMEAGGVKHFAPR